VTTGDVAGSYSDYIGAFIAVAPLGTLSENFDSGLQTGVGGFLIYSSANRGDLAVGQLTITYDLFGEDPTSCDADSDPNCPGWAGEDTLTPAASVFVNTSDYSPPSDTPEPATLTMIGVGLLGFGFIRRRRARG
jgi:hypothetical protein